MSAWHVVDGKPDRDQMQAVLSPVIENVDPELIIVFGSAARGAMTEGSDLDVLIVKEVENLRALAAQARKSLSPEHPPIDIVPATLELLYRHQDSLSWVYGPAVAEGIVAYRKNGRAVQGEERARDTLHLGDESENARMVRVFRYRKEEALDWLRKARGDLTVVKSKDGTIDREARCYSAQAATEKALKALLVARGRRVRGQHILSDFSTELQQAGEVLPASATREQLERLSEYGGPAQYPGWDGETTEDDERRFRKIAIDMEDHARRRVAEILDGAGE